MQLAGSDINKSSIIEKQGMDRLMKLSARFTDDPSMLQEVSNFHVVKLFKICIEFLSFK